jgi:hypothetical protein
MEDLHVQPRLLSKSLAQEGVQAKFKKAWRLYAWCFNP